MKKNCKNAFKFFKVSQKVKLSLGIIIFVMVILELTMRFYSNLRFSNKTAESLITQIVNIIEKNENSDKILQDALKEEYIIRAKSVSYVLENNPQVENNIDELKKIAALMEVDEIHLFDKNGVIVNGSVPKYFGYSMDSGEQMAFFKRMLYNPLLSLCQDLTPNTAEGKEMMYSMVWKEDFSGLVQVGIEPIRLLAELKRHEISEVISSFPLVEGEFIFIADSDSEIIKGSTVDDDIGKSLSEIGFGKNRISIFYQNVERVHNKFIVTATKNYDDYKIIAAFDIKTSNKNLMRNTFIILLYLLLAAFVINQVFNELNKTTLEKQRDYGVLLSMSQMFFTVYLIDLENDKVSEYRSDDAIRKLIDTGVGAIEQMRITMTATITEEYIERVLEFTDLTTLAKRMKGKNYLSCDVVGTYFGWTRVSFYVLENDSEGYPTKVVYTTQNIDDQKKEEEKLLLTSKTDSLTKLFNRRAFEADIEKYKNQDFEDDFVLISMDLNGLKAANDNFGHAAGDELILGAADVMRKILKPFGKIYRMGGDEFIAILKINETEIEKVMNDFFEETKSWRGKLTQSLSISCGFVTGRDAKGKKYLEVEKIADEKMYQAKREYYSKMGIDRRK